MTPYTDVWTTPHTLLWKPWVPFTMAVQGKHSPDAAGLYRIRRIGAEPQDYLGQTGSGAMTLRKRLAMLREVYAAEMPYRDPHTAAPGLWALRNRDYNFEVSCALTLGDTPWRKGLECVEIARHRERYGVSPSLNFGRMPVGYRMSSGNNQQLVASGKRFRGGPTPDAQQSHLPGVPPAGWIGGVPTALNWCGHTWSDWVPAEEVPRDLRFGLYRIRGGFMDSLAYIGEGAISARIFAHLAKTHRVDLEQGRIFADHHPLFVSWVEGMWEHHQRLELENDLIAAHMLEVGAPPVAQFRG